MIKFLLIVAAVVIAVNGKPMLTLNQVMDQGKPIHQIINLGQGALGPLSNQYNLMTVAAGLPKPIAYPIFSRPALAPLVVAEEKYPPKPFTYSFDSIDEYGTLMSRKESSDESGTVTGSYSYQDAKGITRIVNYIADHNGFRAKIQTNEPGTVTSNPAGVEIISSQPSIRK